jgi:hypothetical protein
MLPPLSSRAGERAVVEAGGAAGWEPVSSAIAFRTFGGACIFHKISGSGFGATAGVGTAQGRWY